ncbi:MAG: 3-deoxy-D-manno-octulosonic acid transferase [Planctomycetales bacterium]|nr:3-deoxy-D-manno-octulosonic acid transferase [Planctomycetales bacterium]
MGYLLNLVYLAAILVASPYLLYSAIRHGKYREGWREKFLGSVPSRTGKNKCIWLHAVSVGEVNLLAPLIARWESLYPDWECVISTTTLAGFALARRRYAPRTVFYCPLDFTWSVRRAIRHIRPDLLVLAELELWPNFVSAAKQSGAKIAIINGRLGDKSLQGYQRIRFITDKIMEQIDLVAAQNEEYAQRFRRLGASPAAVSVTGSIKFDGALTDRRNPATKRLSSLASIKESDQVFLAGSTQEPEEALAVSVFSKLVIKHPSLRLILVPRHAERFEDVARMLEKSGLPWQRRSALENEGANPQARVMLVDVIGELGAWWGTASIAFVGGSLGKRGGQNMIEPAAYGAAVSFGPNTWNFRDVVSMLLARDAAVVVKNEEEMKVFVQRCLEDSDYANALGGRARKLVLEQLGATERTVELLSALVDARHMAKQAA